MAAQHHAGWLLLERGIGALGGWLAVNATRRRQRRQRPPPLLLLLLHLLLLLVVLLIGAKSCHGSCRRPLLTDRRPLALSIPSCRPSLRLLAWHWPVLPSSWATWGTQGGGPRWSCGRRAEKRGKAGSNARAAREALLRARDDHHGLLLLVIVVRSPPCCTCTASNGPVRARWHRRGAAAISSASSAATVVGRADCRGVPAAASSAYPPYRRWCHRWRRGGPWRQCVVTDARTAEALVTACSRGRCSRHELLLHVVLLLLHMVMRRVMVMGVR